MTFETRTVAATFEARDDGGQPVIEGYAATFGQPYDMGPFWEQIDSRAFNRTLGANPDVRLLVDHEGQPLARTKSGTLQLSADSQGLHMRASLDSSDPDVQRLLPKMRRGDLDEMSFAFRVAQDGDDWDYEHPQGTMRTLRELSLAGGDVSVVTYPANPNTTVSVRQRDLREAQWIFVERMMAEMRAGRAPSSQNRAKLAELWEELLPPSAEAVERIAAAVMTPSDVRTAEGVEPQEPAADAPRGRSLDLARRLLAAADTRLSA